MELDVMLVPLGKLCLAAFLSGLIGFERESHAESAGLRTCMLVGMGGCLMMLLSLHVESLFSSADAAVVRADPGRIASYALAGMGFIGGGAIIKGKGMVKGVTTAACLWLVTGMGLCIGAGLYVPAMACTALSLVFLYNMRHLKFLAHRREYTTLTVVLSGPDSVRYPAIKTLVEGLPGTRIMFVNYRRDVLAQVTEYSMRLFHPVDLAWGRAVSEIAALPGVAKVAWTESDVP